MNMDVVVQIYKANIYMRRSGWSIEEKREFWLEMKGSAVVNNQSVLPEKITMSNV